MPWTIYCHTHVESCRRYVGLTKTNMMERWKKHCYVAKSSKGGRWYFPNAVRKYGPQAFSHEVLAMSWTLEGANATEEWLIDFYDTRNPEKGFNLAKGGASQPHPIRKNPWDDPEYRAKCSQNMRKYMHTPQARLRQKASLNTPESKAKRSMLSRLALNTPESKAKRVTSSSTGFKICSKCGIEKNVSEFSKQLRGQFGVRKDCKPCVLQRKRSIIVTPLPDDSKRTCTKCHVKKSIVEFHRTRTNRSGYRPECSECRKAAAREYAKNRYWGEKMKRKAA